MSDLIQSIQQLSVPGVIPVVAALVLGVILWLRGRRVLRLGFAGLGLIIGMFAGWLLGEAMSSGFPTWVIAVIAGLGFAVLFALMYRLAVAVAVAGVLAIAAPLAMWTLVDVGVVSADAFDPDEQTVEAESNQEDLPTEGQDEPPSTPEELKEWLREKGIDMASEEAKSHLAQESDELAGNTEFSDEAKQQLVHLQGVAQSLFDVVKEFWLSIEPRTRMLLLATAIIGGLLGALIALLLPKMTAAIATALVGSALMLLCGWVLGVRFVELHARVDFSATIWLLIWLGLSLLGLAQQWKLRRPAKPEAS